MKPAAPGQSTAALTVLDGGECARARVSIGDGQASSERAIRERGCIPWCRGPLLLDDEALSSAGSRSGSSPGFRAFSPMNTSVRLGDVLLGKYRVERVLGKGGMGIVVAARHLELGELFAIKLLLPSTVADPEMNERFIREARAAARLRSEHVARVHDVGRLPSGAPYMVMEHLDGSDLRTLVRRDGPLPIEDAVTYVLQACEAIAEAHGAGIIHRDIKPANLFLIRRPNGSASVKVLDFGISKQTGVDEVELTVTGALLGSPMYMSPEQIARSKSADARSDIWAMGVVLYELVAGRGPFKAATVIELIALVLQEEPEPPRELRPDLPPPLEAVILRCLRKQPGERFQSMGELAAALNEARRPAMNAQLNGTFMLSSQPRSGSLPSLPPLLEPPAVQAQTAAMTRSPSPSQETFSATVGPPAAIIARAPIPPGAAVIEATSPGWGHTRGAAAPKPRSKAPWIVKGAVALAMLVAGAWFAVGISSRKMTASAPELPSASSIAAPAPPPDATAPAAASAPPEVVPAPTGALAGARLPASAPRAAHPSSSPPPANPPPANPPPANPPPKPATPPSATTSTSKAPSIW